MQPEVIEFLLRFGADVRRQLDVNTKVFWGDADSTVFTAYEGCTAPHMLLDALFYTGEQADEKRRRCLELMLNEEYTWQTDNRGYSVFHVAAKCGDVELMRIAVNKAKKSAVSDYVNLRDFADGKTALYIAVESHNLPIVKLLVMEGKALISPATEYNQLSVLHHLLKKGNYVNIELRFREEQDVKNIDRAMREMAIFLIHHSTLKDLRQEDRLGCTPLYHACASGFFEVAALMVQMGAMHAGSGGSGAHLHANPQKIGSSPAIACLRYAHRLLSELKGGGGGDDDAPPLWESEEPSVREAVEALNLVEAMCVEANKRGKRAMAAFAKSLHLGADFQRDELRLPQLEEWPVVQALIEALGGEGRALLSQHL